MPTSPSSVTSSTTVRNAKGACKPYELRSGGSAIAIGCSFSSLMRMNRGKGSYLRARPARVLEPRLPGFGFLSASV